jgi:hypothetical protein
MGYVPFMTRKNLNADPRTNQIYSIQKKSMFIFLTTFCVFPRSVAWRSSPRGVYEALPPSPRCYEKAEKAEQAIASNPVRQKYVPPGMRGGGGGASAATATLNSLRDTGSAVVGRVSALNQATGASSFAKASPSASSGPQRQLLVGEVYEEEDPEVANKANKAKEAAKAEAKRIKKEQAKQQAAEARRLAEEAREREIAEQYKSGTPADIEKELKKLNKKMRQIEALKEKNQATLLPEQRAKLAEEPKLAKLINELETHLGQLSKKK